MQIEEFWKRLERLGIAVPGDVQRRIGLECAQERVLIRPPSTACHKTQVLELGTTVPAVYIARKLGITVRRVQQIRKLMG